MVFEISVCGDKILTTSEGYDDSDTTTIDGCSWQKALAYSIIIILNWVISNVILYS